MNVSGVVVLGMKAGTGDGEPLYELFSDVGEGAAEGDVKWLMGFRIFCIGGGSGTTPGAGAGIAALPLLGANGVMDLGDRLRLLRLQLTDSMGLKHCASGLKVFVTSRSAEFSS